MACRYYYKGREFKSEFELDDFLLEKLPFEPTLGDAVFDMTSAQIQTDFALKKVNKDAIDLRKTYLDAMNGVTGHSVEYGDDGEIAMSAPYIGVNKYLSGLRDLDGKLLFPEFIRINYWESRFSNWKIGNFTEDEIAELGSEYASSETNKFTINNVADRDRLIEKMEKRWKELAKIGSAFHDALKICFTKIQKGSMKGHYVFEIGSIDELKKFIWNHPEFQAQSKGRIITTGDDKYKAIEQAALYAKKLHKECTSKFGSNLIYYPEFMMKAEVNRVKKAGDPNILFGIIDLMVVNEKGEINIIDYKTSVHPYEDYGSPKKRSYAYQLSVYQRMLEKLGISTYGGRVYISPIKIEGFKKKEDGEGYEYSGVLTPELLEQLDVHNDDRLWEAIDSFMPVPFNFSISTQDAMSTITDVMEHWFPDYNYKTSELMDKEDVVELLKKFKKLTPDENGQYTWTKAEKKGLITADSEADFVKKVYEYLKNQPSTRKRLTGEVKAALRQAMLNHDVDQGDFPMPIITLTDKDVDFLKHQLAKYCTGIWEVVDNDLLENYGVLMLKTVDGYDGPEQVEFVRVTTNNLLTNHRKYLKSDDPKKSRKYLTGSFEEDVTQEAKTGSLMLEATNGNIELMELMLLVNLMTGLKGKAISLLMVVNPRYSEASKVTNEELIYCWKELNKFYKVKNDKILDSKEVKFADLFSVAMLLVDNYRDEGEMNHWQNGYEKVAGIRNSMSVLDDAINATSEEKLKRLQQLYDGLMRVTNKGTGSTLDRIYGEGADLQKKEVQLHNAILMAMASLKGVNFRQQLRDHDEYFQRGQWKAFFSVVNFKGFSGTHTDNPGNMDSETLNLVTRLLTEAYLNVRSEMQLKKVKISKLLASLKKEKSISQGQIYAGYNQVNLYDNLTEVTADGDWVFKNPDRLQGAEKEFLEYILTEINRNRFPNDTDEQLKKKRDSNDLSYYRVPLTRGNIDSQVNVEGLMQVAKSKLRFLDPRVSYDKMKNFFEKGASRSEMDDDDEEKSQILFEMTNTFDKGESDGRLDMIKRIGISNFEHNMENLIYKHLFAYSIKDNVDGVFPMIKAAMVHLATLGSLLARPFEHDLKYLSNYIKAKIFNQTIVDPKLRTLHKYLGTLRYATSMFILAFSPVQLFYQPLQGIWFDISLITRKPDGTNAFTFNHFQKALRIVYRDMFHYSEKPTLCSALNELLGLNDMDINMYSERISGGRKSVWNLEDFAMRCATRPDFYNRLAIFLCQMMGDGCLDAHHMSEDGELIYDWKLDKRFDAFANGRKNDPRYNEQKALYYAVATQFVRERARNKDGSLFVLDMKNPKALPRAYTNKQAEAYKSIADDVYGYYSHEKKSLIHAMFVGAMWMLMKSYWSGMKNQYMQPGGVRLRGRWKQTELDWYNEETEQWEKRKAFYQINPETGEIDFEKPPTFEDTGVPMIQWEGQWQEGVLVTMASLLKDTLNNGWQEAWEQKWNAQDLNLQNVYRNNIKQLLYDLCMWIIGGGIMSGMLSNYTKKLKLETKNSDSFMDGLAVSMVDIARASVQHSFLNFNAFETIGGPLMSWQPLSITWSGTQFARLLKAATGDLSMYDALIRIPTATRYFKPALDTLVPSAA